MPSRSIFFRPLWAPRTRRRSAGVRRAPVISHVRHESFVDPASARLSASGISQYSAVPKTPGEFKAPEALLRCWTPRALDLQDPRLGRRHGQEPVEDVRRALA